MATEVQLSTVLGAITTVATIGIEEAPAIIALINEVKALFSSDDQAVIDNALQQLDLAADAQHDAAQKL